MSEFEVVQPEDEIRSSEFVEGAEGQSLDEATHEPGTRVENSHDFAQAEAIEALVSESVSNAERNVAGRAEVAGKPEAQESQAQDPLTGKGYGGQSQSPNDETGEDDPKMTDAGNFENMGNFDSVSDFQSTEQDPGSKEFDPTMIDGNEPVYEMDKDTSDRGREIGEGADPLSDQVSELDPQRLRPESLPQEKQVPIGRGRDGLLFPGGGKGVPGGKGTSGGGLPVGGRGGGSVGSGKEGDGYHSGKGPVGHWLELKAMKDGTSGYVSEPDGQGTWVQDKDGNWHYQETDKEDAPAEKPPQGDPIDGDQPMPYTGGSTGGGGNHDPKGPVGGPDIESGHFRPMAPQGGSSDDGGGGTPGDKDGEDDSGKFLGDPNLSGGDVRPPDDDIPYNKLDQAKDDLLE